MKKKLQQENLPEPISILSEDAEEEYTTDLEDILDLYSTPQTNEGKYYD